MADKLLERLEAVLGSSIPSEPARIWTWLHLRGGRAGIGEVLGRFPAIAPALADLEKRGLIDYEGLEIIALQRAEKRTVALDPITPKGVRGKDPSDPDHTKARPSAARVKAVVVSAATVKAAFKKPRAPGNPEIIEKAMGRVFRLYNAARRAKGVFPLKPVWEKKSRSHLRILARRFAEQGIDAKEYILFAHQKTLWQKHPFPPLANVAGDYVYNLWCERGSAPATGHAGARRASGDDELTLEMEVAFGSKYDEAAVRHIEAQGRLLKSHAHLYGGDVLYDKEIRWYAEREEEA